MIKIKLNEGQFIEFLKDMLLFMICVTSLALAAFNAELREQSGETKTRYEQIKEDNTKLIKINNEQNEYIKQLLKEADLQPNVTNNRDTRY